MNQTNRKVTHDRIVNDYFFTTSFVNSAPDQRSFMKSVRGIQRRLGSWCDVKGLDIADLGSGTGELCKLVKLQGSRRIVGVNLSKDEITFAKKHVDAEFIQMDILDFLNAQREQSFDIIFALNILEHFDKEKLYRVLEGTYRCLKSGGRLVAMVPNATSPFGSMTRYWDITHHIAFTPSSVRQLSRLVGFGENAEFRECGPVPYAPKSYIRYLLWRTVRLFIKAYLMIELASDKGNIYTSDMLLRLTKK